MLLFFLGNGVLAFSGLSRLLGALYLPGELLQLSQQTLVGETERLHLVSFWCVEHHQQTLDSFSRRSAIYVTLLVLHP